MPSTDSQAPSSQQQQQQQQQQQRARPADAACCKPLPPAVRLPRWTWLLVPLALVVAGFLGVDRWFYEQVSLKLNTPAFDRDFYAVTKPFWVAWRYAFGYAIAGWAAMIVVVVLRPQRWRAVLIAVVAVIAAALLANVLEGVIGRLRPNQADSHLAFAPPFSQLLSKKNVSFPSGEATTAFGLAVVLAAVLPRGRWFYYVAAAVAAGARLVNGAHYVSDAAAGCVLGCVVAAAVLRWLNFRRHDACAPA